MLPSTLLLDKRTIQLFSTTFLSTFKVLFEKSWLTTSKSCYMLLLLCRYILHSSITACQAGVFSEQNTWTQKRSKHQVASESNHLVVQSTSNFDSTTWKKHKIVPDENIPVFTFCAQVMNFLKLVWIIEYSRQNFLSKNYSVSRTFVTEN